MGFGMRCHDLVAKGKIDDLMTKLQENKIECVQLALKKSIFQLVIIVAVWLIL